MTTRARLPIGLTILETLRDPKLLGHVFGALSWRVWVALAAVAWGLGYGLSADEQELAAALIGARPLPRARVRELWIIASRRAGKSIFAAALAIFLAAFQTYPLAPGEVGTVIVISPSQKQSRVIKRYISGLMHSSPLLRSLIANETADEIVLTNGHVIEMVTASKVAPRGRTLIAVIVDEGAFLPVDDSAAEPLSEILTACRPGLATTDGLLVIIGSPYAQQGPMFETFTRHFGQDSDVLVVKGASQQFNPTIKDTVITQALETDPSAARAEWLGEFRADLEGYITREAAEAVRASGRIELAPVPGVRYRAVLDFAGGTLGGDSAAMGIAHSETRERRQIEVVDVIREVRPPFSPADVCRDFAGVLHAYGCSVAEADRWAGGFPVEAMSKFGVRLVPCERVKSEIYADALGVINSRACELPDVPRLFAQLVALERRTGRGGRDAIDHPPGGHDDLVNAALGSVVSGLTPEPGFVGYMRSKAEGAAIAGPVPALEVEPADEDARVLAHQQCRLLAHRPATIVDGDRLRCSKCGAIVGRPSDEPTPPIVRSYPL
jgi:hypothetical protein